MPVRFWLVAFKGCQKVCTIGILQTSVEAYPILIRAQQKVITRSFQFESYKSNERVVEIILEFGNRGRVVLDTEFRLLERP